ncbi:MAG TPA: lysophospholipid acyltransferase family protein [Fimbriimonas sp.]
MWPEGAVVTLKDRWRVVRPKVLGGIAYAIVRTLGSLVRVRFEGFDKVEACRSAILCSWHGRTFVFANAYRNRGAWVIISQSKDGDLQTTIFRRLGYRIIRGSTGRGGVRAAVEAIRALREGGLMAMTPDGPRGPSGVVQSGVMTIAQKSGAALIPVGVSAAGRWLFRSWDRYLIPHPFTRAVILAGEPIYVPADATESEVEAIRQRFEDEINRVEAEAERAMGHPPQDAKALDLRH